MEAYVTGEWTRSVDVCSECRSANHAWSDLVETMGIEPTTPCLKIRKIRYQPDN
jgi:hypothetical protein